MRNHKGKDTVEDFERRLLSKICKQCGCAVLEHHHEYPHLYYKCPQCSYMVAIENPIITSVIQIDIKTDLLPNSAASDKPDEEID